MEQFDFLFQKLRMLSKQFQFLFHLAQILLLIQLSELQVMLAVKFSFRRLLRKTNLDDLKTKIFYQEKFKIRTLESFELKSLKLDNFRLSSEVPNEVGKFLLKLESFAEVDALPTSIVLSNFIENFPISTVTFQLPFPTTCTPQKLKISLSQKVIYLCTDRIKSCSRINQRVCWNNLRWTALSNGSSSLCGSLSR